MRPDRAIVIAAIRKAGGNMSKTAGILGCSRQTLYTWCYQLGLEKLAGIRIDTRDGLDRRACKDTSVGKPIKSSVYSGAEKPSNLSLVPAQETIDQIIPITVRIPQSLWKDIRARALYRDCTAAQIVQKALEAELQAEEPKRKATRGKSGQ